MKTVVWMIALTTSLYAQESIFPDYEGELLLDKIREEYKPNTVLTYNEAREYMFRNVYNRRDTLEGTYSGYKVHLPSNTPLVIDFLAEEGINTEHIYPRSKGASEENGNAIELI